MYKILVLEDDELFASTLEDFLIEEKFVIDIAKDGEECLSLNYENNYDLYIFDIKVPKISGLELLSSLRNSEDNTPTIFLTSYKDKDTLQEAFVKGCDDYLKKPVDLDELLLRIKALLKRNKKQFELIKLTETLDFNPINKRIYENGIDLNLPTKILDLIELFIENRGDIVTKEMIINRLWAANEDYSEGSIRVYINQIKKLFSDANVIVNIKGIGYKIEF
ncbi:response regulator transcription factor [Aliarcobacter butzleri]|uniref:Response regulator transcription factor n=1 Tax=Aliarcobacter butzleri TaxID=28197 RepID=A0AAW6VLJ9_9BACT|nr:response regulator transcription factor [Aliarcobacter butzleri]MCT7579051.1 response regulator transcription factor [Aliarcobacter butzleri]MCT7595656.1 response regulator transcription factor [Aliarcobacter butzleri]MCT7600144.1 response regulator transcription factor [Aliarcobacter butzleri]MCT7647856.1 response regulator transcription factor [Aliarcobacter butzleri]MCT7652067.1 response regulator transcription factor [Aliarcobacter butzleri]